MAFVENKQYKSGVKYNKVEEPGIKLLYCKEHMAVKKQVI